MDTVTYVITRVLKTSHGKGKEITSCPLDPRLKYTRTDQRVPSPLPSQGVLTVDSDTHLVGTPGGWQQLDLWVLPTDQPSTR